jgi:hypothetical protein
VTKSTPVTIDVWVAMPPPCLSELGGWAGE